MEKEQFSVRAFLQQRQALLVHFSTVMSSHDEFLFPEDMRNAMRLVGEPLSFSTILATDVAPFQTEQTTQEPSSANAGGNVGIVVDILDNASVVTVGPGDSGTGINAMTSDWHSGGRPPTAEACASSLDDRKDTNEWYVKDFKTLGLFVLGPIHVRQVCWFGSERIIAEGRIIFQAVLDAFPNERIFSSKDGEFVEIDRANLKWVPVKYGDIVPPC